MSKTLTVNVPDAGHADQDAQAIVECLAKNLDTETLREVRRRLEGPARVHEFSSLTVEEYLAHSPEVVSDQGHDATDPEVRKVVDDAIAEIAADPPEEMEEAALSAVDEMVRSKLEERLDAGTPEPR